MRSNKVGQRRARRHSLTSDEVVGAMTGLGHAPAVMLRLPGADKLPRAEGSRAARDRLVILRLWGRESSLSQPRWSPRARAPAARPHH